MIILGIETSCDETAISVIESADGAAITVLADKTLSQIELHKQYGGVFPTMAKREHSRNLLPLLKTVLEEAGLEITNNPARTESVRSGGQTPITKQIPIEKIQNLKQILEREPELLEQFLEYIPTIEKPPTRPVRSREGSQRDFASNGIDAIAVTEGPGLEPCLWTGINLAKALSLVWDVPVVPVNHMEGHIFSSLLRRKEIINDQETITKQIPNSKIKIRNQESISYQLKAISYPSLSLLISGGHTELVLIKDIFQYEIIGQTKDDAVGEAFDKVARLLGLPYPGGPEISKLGEEARKDLRGSTSKPPERLNLSLPRPMLHSKDFNFSFSGLKTAVLYLLKTIPELTDELRRQIALEFENAVTEVLVIKTKAAAEQHGARALLIGGGVIANTHIRKVFQTLGEELDVPVHIPEKNLTTDNALMIAVAGLLHKDTKTDLTKAKGNLSF